MRRMRAARYSSRIAPRATLPVAAASARNAIMRPQIRMSARIGIPGIREVEALPSRGGLGLQVEQLVEAGVHLRQLHLTESTERFHERALSRFVEAEQADLVTDKAGR